MGLSSREDSYIICSPCHRQGAPHQSNAVSEPAWPPAVSLQCRAAAEQRQTLALLLHCRSGARSVGKSRGTITLPGNHLPGHPATLLLWGREGVVPPSAHQATSVLPQDCRRVCGNRQFWHWVGCGCSQLCTCAHTDTQTHRHEHIPIHLPWTVGCLPTERHTADAFGSFMKCQR